MMNKLSRYIAKLPAVHSDWQFVFFGSYIIHPRFLSFFGLIVFTLQLIQTFVSRFRNIGLTQLILAMIPCSSNSKIGSGHRSSPVSGARFWNRPQNSFIWSDLGFENFKSTDTFAASDLFFFCFYVFFGGKGGWPRWRDAKTEALLVVKELEYQICVWGRFHDQGSGSVPPPRQSQQCVAHYQL